jgi:hypothetical protein
MKKQIITLLFLVTTILVYGQVQFEQGYIINNNGDKISCYIKNLESLRTPSRIQYKLNLSDSETLTGNLGSIKEFGIPGKFKYQRQTVELDTEGYRVTTQRNPVFETKTVFTKVLIEGPASLYSHFDGETSSFFYTLEDKGIHTPKTLIYKDFITNENKIRKNESFKQELMNNLICENLTQNDFINVKYFESSLLPLFVKYNSCIGGNFEVFKEKRKGIFNLKVAPRVAFNSLFTGLSNDNRIDAHFDDQTQFNFGIEFEYIMPFNKNKWSVFIEPTYQYFKEEDKPIDYNNVTVSINYSSIEVPIGIRYFIFLNNSSKVFINVAFIPDLVLKNEFEYTLISDGNRKLISIPNFAFGFGYNLNNRFDIEFRQHTNRNFFTGGKYYAEYKSSSIILRYNVL